MDQERDPLDISSEDLALLQDSQNIEFVVEDDQASGTEEGIYLYEGDSENEDNDNIENENSDNEGQASNVEFLIHESTDEDDYEMYECLDGDDVAPMRSKKQNKSKDASSLSNSKIERPQRNMGSTASQNKEETVTERNTMIKSPKITKTTDINTSQKQEKIVTPKILKIQGGVVSPPMETDKTMIDATANTVQTNTKFIPVAPQTITNSSSIVTSVGVQKFLPDQAVLKIIKALGLSVEDIEKHGGTVAISIPDNLIQNGVLDLTKVSSVTQNVTPSKGMQPENRDVPSIPVATMPTEHYLRNKKYVPILPKKKCYVEGCENYEDKNNIFFPVPHDQEMMKVWDICLGSVSRRLQPLDRICTKHFHKSDILITKSKKGSQETIQFRLTAGAVPCIKFYKSCCVPGCVSRDPDKMYNFPVYSKTNLELWMYMIRNPSLKTLNIKELLRHRVCYKHFDIDSFSDDSELRRTAAPTRFLPEYKLVTQGKVSPTIPDFSTIKLYCAYKKCIDRLNPTKKVFPFPPEFDRCQDWLFRCDRLDLLCPTAEATIIKLFYLKFGVCENHFGQLDFEDRTREALHPSARPRHFEGVMVIDDKKLSSAGTISTPKDDDDDDEGDLLETSREKSKKILPYVCFYLGCNKRISKRGGNKFYSFPKDPERCKLWLEACGYKNFGDVYVSYKICNLHFTSKMFGKDGNLKPNAVPIKSAQTIDGPSESRNEPTKNVVDPAKTIDDKLMNIEIPGEEDGYFDTLDAIVAKWADKSKLEFLRCAIPRCDKVFTNENYRGNAQLFPDPVKQNELYNLWLKVIGSPVLLAMTPEILRQTYVVCNKHFDESTLLNGGTTLTANSIPTKGIPIVTQIENSKENFLPLLSQQSTTIPITSIKPVRTRAPPIKTTKFDGLQWKALDSVDLANSKDKTMCLLEDSNIVFPGMGYYLVDYPKDPKKFNKRPYGVYQYRAAKKMYGLTNDIEFGEALNIHTAIVIDDDDAVEMEVMQKILDNRLKP